jgi:hypothetical protein
MGIPGRFDIHPEALCPKRLQSYQRRGRGKGIPQKDVNSSKKLEIVRNIRSF